MSEADDCTDEYGAYDDDVCPVCGREMDLIESNGHSMLAHYECHYCWKELYDQLETKKK